MSDYRPNWEDDWSTLISAQNIANAGDLPSDEVSLDQHWSAEVSVAVTYGATATQGVKVYVLREVDASPTFEGEADSPWGFEMPYAASATRRRTFSVDGLSLRDFKVHLSNDSGAQVTATVKYRRLEKISSQ